jgi:hypothetical protein
VPSLPFSLSPGCLDSFRFASPTAVVTRPISGAVRIGALDYLSAPTPKRNSIFVAMRADCWFRFINRLLDDSSTGENAQHIRYGHAERCRVWAQVICDLLFR